MSLSLKSTCIVHKHACMVQRTRYMVVGAYALWMGTYMVTRHACTTSLCACVANSRLKANGCSSFVIFDDKGDYGTLRSSMLGVHNPDCQYGQDMFPKCESKQVPLLVDYAQ